MDDNSYVGVQEYQQELQDSKDKLGRLRKGRKMIADKRSDGDILAAEKLVDMWMNLADEVFTHLEHATMIHQHNLGNKGIMIRTDGSLVPSDQLVEEEGTTIDPSTLFYAKLLQELTGEDLRVLKNLQDVAGDSFERLPALQHIFGNNLRHLKTMYDIFGDDLYRFLEIQTTTPDDF